MEFCLFVVFFFFFFFKHLCIVCNAADQEQEKEVMQAKLDEALLEKEQVSNDLNSMERSLSDLFKRLDKYKDIIEGYKKVRNLGKTKKNTKFLFR